MLRAHDLLLVLEQDREQGFDPGRVPRETRPVGKVTPEEKHAHGC